MKSSRHLALLLAGTAWSGLIAQAPPSTVVDGIYILYDHPEGPYMSAFYPCERGGHWAIAGGAAFGALKAAYKGAETSQFGELFVQLQGTFRPLDRRRFPEADVDGYFTVAVVKSFSADRARIEACQVARGDIAPKSSP